MEFESEQKSSGRSSPELPTCRRAESDHSCVGLPDDLQTEVILIHARDGLHHQQQQISGQVVWDVLQNYSGGQTCWGRNHYILNILFFFYFLNEGKRFSKEQFSELTLLNQLFKVITFHCQCMIEFFEFKQFIQSFKITTFILVRPEKWQVSTL